MTINIPAAMASCGAAPRCSASRAERDEPRAMKPKKQTKASPKAAVLISRSFVIGPVRAPAEKAGVTTAKVMTTAAATALQRVPPRVVSRSPVSPSGSPGLSCSVKAATVVRLR